MENFKSMYPREIRMIQSYVSEACDRMDYQNSPMYKSRDDDVRRSAC